MRSFTCRVCQYKIVSYEMSIVDLHENLIHDGWVQRGIYMVCPSCKHRKYSAIPQPEVSA